MFQKEDGSCTNDYFLVYQEQVCCLHSLILWEEECLWNNYQNIICSFCSLVWSLLALEVLRRPNPWSCILKKCQFQLPGKVQIKNTAWIFTKYPVFNTYRSRFRFNHLPSRHSPSKRNHLLISWAKILPAKDLCKHFELLEWRVPTFPKLIVLFSGGSFADTKWMFFRSKKTCWLA